MLQLQGPKCSRGDFTPAALAPQMQMTRRTVLCLTDIISWDLKEPAGCGIGGHWHCVPPSFFPGAGERSVH